MLDLETIGIAVDTSGLQAGQQALNQTATAANRTADAADHTSMSFGTMSKAMFVANVATEAFMAAVHQLEKAFDFIKDSAMLAARFETMGVVMGIAGNNAGYTRKQMDEFAESLQKSGISMLQSRNSLTQLATANIDLAKAAELGRAAQDLAVVGNVNSSEAMGRMIQGIKSGEVEILRTLGLNVNFEMSYQRMAAQMGKATDKLTEHDKVMARTNAALQAAASYNGIYEESLGTAGKMMKTMERYWEDLKLKLGDTFLPGLTTIVFNFSDALKGMNKELDDAGQSGLLDDIGALLNGVVKTGFETVAVLGANVAFVFKAMGREIGGIAAQAAAVAHLDFSGAAAIGKAMTEDSTAAAKALEHYEQRIMSASETQHKAAKMSEEDRMAAGKVMRDKAAADEKAAAAAKLAFEHAKKMDEAYKGQTSSLRVKLEEQKQEIDQSEPLAESQKLLAQFIEDLGDKYKGMSIARQLNIENMIHELSLGEQVLKQRKDDLEWMKDASAWEAADRAAKQQGLDAIEATRKSVYDYVDSVQEEADILEIQANAQGKANSEVQKAVAIYKIQAALKKKLADIDATEGGTSGDKDLLKARAIEAAMQQQTTAMGNAANGYTAYMQQIQTESEQMAAITTKLFKGMEDSLVNFVKTGKLDFGSLADSIISDLIRIQIQKSITGPLSAAINGSGGLASFFGLPSFDGGGFTGGGGRAGGVDGKGGFMAVMHPNESVIDHTKGQSTGGGSLVVNQPIVINAPNASAETIGTIRSLMPGLIQENKRVIESVIRQSMAARGGRLVV